MIGVVRNTEQPSTADPRAGIDHQMRVFDVISVFQNFYGAILSALAASFQRDISAVSETHSADIRQ